MKRSTNEEDRSEDVKNGLCVNLCPKCYPKKKSLLFVSPQRPGTVVCGIHGPMEWHNVISG